MNPLNKVSNCQLVFLQGITLSFSELTKMKCSIIKILGFNLNGGVNKDTRVTQSIRTTIENIFSNIEVIELQISGHLKILFRTVSVSGMTYVNDEEFYNSINIPQSFMCLLFIVYYCISVLCLFAPYLYLWHIFIYFPYFYLYTYYFVIFDVYCVLALTHLSIRFTSCEIENSYTLWKIILKT